MSKASTIASRILAVLILALLAGYALRKSFRRDDAAMAASPTTVRYQQQDKLARQHNAIAFLLGWDSELVLVEEDPHRQEEYLSSIKSKVHDLSLEPKLKHPLEYYFHPPLDNIGSQQRAQDFADEVRATLLQSNKEAANHFSGGHNLLLDLTDARITEAERRANIEKLVVLDLPAELTHLPAENLMGWADKVHEYFLSAATPETTRPPQAALPHDQANLYEDPGLKEIFATCNAAADPLPAKCQNEKSEATITSNGVVCHWECRKSDNPHQPQHGPWTLMHFRVEDGKGASR